MKMIVGLGNPGPKYVATRHNIGFILVDAIAESGNWRNKFNAEECRIHKEQDVILLKPMTYMNRSGQSIAAAMKFYKIEPQDVLIIHDELDLAPGRIKLKSGGGHAGHNGLRSTIEHVGADFQRLRVGIGHPGDKSQVSNYVLHDFGKTDQDWIANLQDRIPAAISYWLDDNPSRFIEALNPNNPSDKAKIAKPTAIKKAEKHDEKPAPNSPFDALKSLFKK